MSQTELQQEETGGSEGDASGRRPWRRRRSLPAAHSWLRSPPVDSNNPAHRYFLTTDPVTGRLYVSDTNSRRVYRPVLLSGVRDLMGTTPLHQGSPRPTARRWILGRC